MSQAWFGRTAKTDEIRAKAILLVRILAKMQYESSSSSSSPSCHCAPGVLASYCHGRWGPPPSTPQGWTASLAPHPTIPPRSDRRSQPPAPNSNPPRPRHVTPTPHTPRRTESGTRGPVTWLLAAAAVNDASNATGGWRESLVIIPRDGGERVASVYKKSQHELSFVRI